MKLNCALKNLAKYKRVLVAPEYSMILKADEVSCINDKFAYLNLSQHSDNCAISILTL